MQQGKKTNQHYMHLTGGSCQCGMKKAGTKRRGYVIPFVWSSQTGHTNLWLWVGTRAPWCGSSGKEGIDHKRAWGLGVMAKFYILIMRQPLGVTSVRIHWALKMLELSNVNFAILKAALFFFNKIKQVRWSQGYIDNLGATSGGWPTGQEH